LLTRGLADEGRPYNIRVFGVAPGAVETKMLLDLFPQFPPEQMLKPDDVAGLVEWLCDERCAASSGETIGSPRANNGSESWSVNSAWFLKRLHHYIRIYSVSAVDDVPYP